MDQTTNLTQNVDSLFTNLENFAQKEGLIGKPVTHESKTFFPIISVSLGYGTGSTDNKSAQGTATAKTAMGAGNMSGGALGLGAKLCTDAILIVDKANVSMIPLGSAATSQLVSKIPQILSNIGGQGQGQSQQQNQSQQQSGQTTV